MTIKDILDRPFRANPAYHLVVYDRLPEAEQERLQALAQDPDFYGVLINGPQTKAVDPETALLVLTLREPGPIPSYVRRKFGRTANQAIAELVLDDVLQIAVEDEFFSGAAARAVIYGGSAPVGDPKAHRLAHLSRNALRYAQQLPLMPHDRLAQRLYTYNTVPLSARWQRRLPNEAAVETWLGINGWMTQAWQRTDQAEAGGWMSWRHRRADPAALPYKLYISPHPEGLAEVFRPIVETLARWRVPSFKIGKDAYGILRPDKMVAYLPNFEHLADLAKALQREISGGEISGARAQGVPFTAPIDAEGLFSWAMDPPEAAQVFAPDPHESWRYWITQQLAAALLTARSTDPSSIDPSVEPWQYALDRLALEGIDTQRWIPNQSIWEARREHA